MALLHQPRTAVPQLPFSGRSVLRVRCSAVSEDQRGLNVVVVGLAESGRAAAKLALARGANVVGVDIRPDIAPLEADSPALPSGRLRTELGPHNPRTLLSADRLVLSPGVPLTAPGVREAVERGVPVVSELAFAAEALPAGIPIAAISGTNGGNLGTPLSAGALALLRDPSAFDSVVVEVSSYQLESPGTFRPKVGLILNLTPDHMERHGSIEEYARCKCAMFARMGAGDLAVTPAGDALLDRLASEAIASTSAAASGGGASGGGANAKAGGPFRAWLGALPGAQLREGPGRGCAVLRLPPGVAAQGDEQWDVPLAPLRAIGGHNARNAAHAALAAAALGMQGVTAASLAAAVARLEPPPHRMELVGTVVGTTRVGTGVGTAAAGVSYVNDSKATNVESTLAGLEGLPREQKVVVLLGGKAKEGVAGPGGGLGFERLAPVLQRQARAVVPFGAAGPRIAAELTAAGVRCEAAVPGLAAAVAAASSLARDGDAVVLSPACASFDEFRGFEHRGEVFRELVREMMR